MAKLRSKILFIALAGTIGCQDTQRRTAWAYDGDSKVVFQVHGMMKAKSGAT